MIIIPLIFAVFYPVDFWQNEILEEIQVRGTHFTSTPSVRPYGTTSIDSLKGDHIAERLWLPNLTARIQCDTIKVLRIRPVIINEQHGFTLHLEPVIKFGNDSLPPSYVFKNLFSGDYERVFVRYDRRSFGVFIGREAFSLGPSPRYNLLLSGYGPPPDWLHSYMQIGRTRISFYLTRLENLVCKPVEYVGDTITQLIRASSYVTIRRLDVSLFQWLNLSFSEAAVFGGEEEFPLDFYHLNPLVLLYVDEYNRAQNANIFFDLDARIFLKNASFYSALLVDDFQLDPDPNKEPNHMGVNLGLELADLFFRNTFVFLEYSRVSRYTYCHFYPYQRYEFRGYPLGSPYGPDFDELYFKYTCHFSAKFDIYALTTLLRKGAETIETPWPIPDPDRVPGRDFPENNFLSGVVQRSYSFGAGLKFFYKHLLVLELFAGYNIHRNYDHIAGADKGNPLLRVGIDCINLSND